MKLACPAWRSLYRRLNPASRPEGRSVREPVVEAVQVDVRQYRTDDPALRRPASVFLKSRPSITPARKKRQMRLNSRWSRMR